MLSRVAFPALAAGNAIIHSAIEHKAKLLYNDRDFDAIAKVCDLSVIQKVAGSAIEERGWTQPRKGRHGLDAAEQNKRYILVVDSDDEDLFLACMLLRKFGHAIMTARGGEKALEFMTVSPPAVIVADPASGVDRFLSRIRQDPRFYDIPVVLLSWWPNVSLAEWRKTYEFFADLKKPIDAVQLYCTVEAAVLKGPRQSIRITTQIMVTLEDGLAGNNGLATTLSEYGLFFRTPYPRKVGSRISASLRIKDADIRLEAVVLYVIPFEEGPFYEPGMGMKFLTISRPDRDLIAAFILEELEKGIR